MDSSKKTPYSYFEILQNISQIVAWQFLSKSVSIYILAITALLYGFYWQLVIGLIALRYIVAWTTFALSFKKLNEKDLYVLVHYLNYFLLLFNSLYLSLISYQNQNIGNKRSDKTAKEHNQSAFNFLLDRFWNDVYGFQLKRTENENDAEDITIQTFSKAFDKIETL